MTGRNTYRPLSDEDFEDVVPFLAALGNRLDAVADDMDGLALALALAAHNCKTMADDSHLSTEKRVDMQIAGDSLTLAALSAVRVADEARVAAKDGGNALGIVRSLDGGDTMRLARVDASLVQWLVEQTDDEID